MFGHQQAFRTSVTQLHILTVCIARRLVVPLPDPTNPMAECLPLSYPHSGAKRSAVARPRLTFRGLSESSRSGAQDDVEVAY